MHAKCEDTNKSPKILSAVENKLDTVIRWFVDKWGKSCKAKTPPGDFKVTIHFQESTKQQSSGYKYKESYQLPLAYLEIPAYSWTFTLIPNWTWSWNSIFFLDAQTSNLWLTLCMDLKYETNSSNLNRCCWLQSFSFQQQWRSGSTWLQNLMAYKRDSFTQRK